MASLTAELLHRGTQVAQRLVEFVNASPSPFHAVDNAKTRLIAAGYKQLSERASWTQDLKPNGKFFFTRNNSSIVAFAIGGKYAAGNGLKIIGAHTDSPNLQVKTVSATGRTGFQQVSVATYGGGLWHTWFDRDLTVAGRVIYREGDALQYKLVHVKRPILRVPTLCIHLQSDEERSAFKPNKEAHITPVLCTQLAAQLNAFPEATSDIEKKHHPVLLSIVAKEANIPASSIVDFELSVVDTQPAVIGGALEEFVFSPRLDNLTSSFIALEALIQSQESLAEDPQVRVIALFDNEEVGSDSVAGAGCTHVESLINRLSAELLKERPDIDSISRANSFMLSADLAHAVHPCYTAKHHDLHQPQIHKGVVFKFNFNQRYATNARTAAPVRELARRNNIPIQDFMVANDTPCGSTIGPILSTRSGIRTIDIGIPQLSMHSIRETCGVVDTWYYQHLFQEFFHSFHKIAVTDDE
eukprot:TRINITY_DN2530_c0_g1_i1.p1 TRINITY_DN2530_c0_g1~~TRINITY_DN2530_c0_g1_i1.p1  ORF type:complete len:477 (-),score=94.85 TRINITY_DN2530_c0_g1_i1:19-1428(-)